MPLPVTTIERDIHLIKFKFARILRTDMGRWTEAEQALQIGMLNDNWYQHQVEIRARRLRQIIVDAVKRLAPCGLKRAV